MSVRCAVCGVRCADIYLLIQCDGVWGIWSLCCFDFHVKKMIDNRVWNACIRFDNWY